jgi:hypothetical protein
MLVMSKDEFEEVCKGQYDTNFAILSCNISVWETNKNCHDSSVGMNRYSVTWISSKLKFEIDWLTT